MRLSMREDSLEEIQSKIAYLERAATELSDVVFRQQQEIQSLGAQLRAVKDRIAGAQIEESSSGLDQEKPPHY
jgi:uncharacterized coiled-coil protein SlyX